MKSLLIASVFAAIAAFGLVSRASPNVASAQEAAEPGDEVIDGEENQPVEAAQCYTVWSDVHAGPGKHCISRQCCNPGCELIDPTCVDI